MSVVHFKNHCCFRHKPRLFSVISNDPWYLSFVSWTFADDKTKPASTIFEVTGCCLNPPLKHKRTKTRDNADKQQSCLLTYARNLSQHVKRTNLLDHVDWSTGTLSEADRFRDILLVLQACTVELLPHSHLKLGQLSAVRVCDVTTDRKHHQNLLNEICCCCLKWNYGRETVASGQMQSSDAARQRNDVTVSCVSEVEVHDITTA